MRNLIRKYWHLTAVAVLCFAAGAFAQVHLALQPTVTSNPSLAGVYVGAYPVTINGVPAAAVCDDFAHEIYLNESWQANVNTFSSLSSTTATNFPDVFFTGTSTTSQLQLYEEAAWLTGQLLNPANAAYAGNLSYAIWQVFDSGSFSWLENHTISNNLSTPYSAAWWLSQAQQSYGSGNYSNFAILTPINGTARCGSGPCPSAPPQEFLVRTPESPAAVLLGVDLLALVGFIVVFRRRMVRAAN